ncbi:MAG: hypothetical protein ACRESZ_16250 [Methylococcales bacterium]
MRGKVGANRTPTAIRVAQRYLWLGWVDSQYMDVPYIWQSPFRVEFILPVVSCYHPETRPD